jgi:hypothetical protein
MDGWEFSDTPPITVRSIAATGNGPLEVIYLSYVQGALYRCIENRCARFLPSPQALNARN